ncbi:hypothetical protein [Sphingomonas paucimobilis]|uniref:hypothetical protein n=1 Tax=Sphingomonas paucimobilis TaxID=13689 RepID=UPI0030F6CE2C
MTPDLDPVAAAIEAAIAVDASLVRKTLIDIADSELAGLVRPSLRDVAIYGSDALLVQIATALSDHAAKGMVVDKFGNISFSEGSAPLPRQSAPEGRSL